MAHNTVQWQRFLNDAPERVLDVIENGPFPLTDYDASKLSWPDKKKGMMRYKGGEGNVSVKSGQKAVVYFDPQFCDEAVENIPDPIEARHSHSQVVSEFRKL